ncbi:MAG: helix-turn-helix domain-containing protein [Lachnospiraceae bacterium]|nr:helix-turn-helix domain-containing protein [Lachnospiraceae bacterium]
MAKYTVEIKIAACKEYLDGKLSHKEICQKYGISFNESNRSSILNDWILRYQELGENAFIRSKGNRSYQHEEKVRIVEEYLAGGGSLGYIAAKYGIPSKDTLRSWVLKYNANRELKDYNPKRGVYMAEARRKTTIEERKEIVEYCLSHDRDYKGTASLYDVSYSQVYSWVRKYDATGEEGLSDKRGRHKTDDEVDELERLRRENKRLKRQLKENDMLVQLLKKVKEFEGM